MKSEKKFIGGGGVSNLSAAAPMYDTKSCGYAEQQFLFQ
jgi:hypothetical protein